jgi:hypothetical protein
VSLVLALVLTLLPPPTPVREILDPEAPEEELDAAAAEPSAGADPEEADDDAEALSVAVLAAAASASRFLSLIIALRVRSGAAAGGRTSTLLRDASCLHWARWLLNRWRVGSTGTMPRL